MVERLLRRPSILPPSSPVAAEREWLRASSTRSFQVLREQDGQRLRRRILVDIEELSARRLAVSGMVELYGKRLPFRISY